MAEVLVVLFLLALCSWLSFNLGVRRERGRQMRYEEATRPQAVPKQGVRLKTLKIRR